MELPKRKQHRLQGFDYSTPANYFITIVTEGRDNLFGSIVDENICLYEAGRMVLNTYKTLVENYECGLEPINTLRELIRMDGNILVKDYGNEIIMTI